MHDKSFREKEMESQLIQAKEELAREHKISREKFSRIEEVLLNEAPTDENY